MGPDSSFGSATLKVPFCVAFSPHKVDEQGFVILMSKNVNKWASTTVSLPLHSSNYKPKAALKSLCKFLQAHTVEVVSNNKAASMCAKTPLGGYVCILAKIAKDGTSISADIKCLAPGGNSKTESQTLVDAIAAVLADTAF